MVLGNNNRSYHKESKMGESFIVDPCAFFDNFNNYISKESIQNGSGSFNTGKIKIDTEFIKSKSPVEEIDTRKLKKSRAQ